MKQALSVLGIAFFVAGTALGNTIEVGSFDSFDGREFDGWSIYGAIDPANPQSMGAGTISQDSAVKFGNAGSSLLLTFTQKGSVRLNLSKKRPMVDIVSGTKYKLQFQVKSEGGPFEIRLETNTVDAVKKAPRSFGLNFETTAEWQTKSVEFVAQPDELLLFFYITIGNSKGAHGKVWLDEVDLVELP